ncbi:hypothetical protein Mhypo_03451 [Meiothermus hypogaeus]|uniref:Uncharacterized protein n=1 Tax=Meiothermus hypogaeus TaxID=884155 RepID=A0ABX9MHQ5_9DEIN|nr:hypothetical protein Mhypo_03451 [Meiothermus hypogaeus]
MGSRSVTAGLPSVRVPVLSKTTVSMAAVASSAVAFLNSTPSRAATPTPTVIAVGVARASASGQAITTAETATVRAKTSPCAPRKYQKRKVSTPEPSAMNTRYFPARSARRCAGALEAWALRTICTMRESAVSAPTAVALKVKAPVWFTVPPTTFAPGVLAAGIGSPVIMLSST